jgi:hypothetical protein
MLEKMEDMPEVALGVSLILKLKTRNLHSPYKDMTKLDLLALF